MSPEEDRAKFVNVVFLENNPLDRAVLDLYLSDTRQLETQEERKQPRKVRARPGPEKEQRKNTEFTLRYSYGGVVVNERELLQKIHDRELKPSDTIVLFDLGLSREAELLMSDEEVRALLGSDKVIKYLMTGSKQIPKDRRYARLEEVDLDVYRCVERIGGIRALFKARLENPMILCGIVSHYVADDIRWALAAFLMHGSNLNPEDYARGEFKEVARVVNKAALVGIRDQLEKTWEIWQGATKEFYCKDVVERSLIEDAQGSVTTLSEQVAKMSIEPHLRPGTEESPIFVLDLLGLGALRGSKHTLQRVFKRVFPFLERVDASNVGQMGKGRQYLTVVDLDSMETPVKNSINRVRDAHEGQQPEQLVCVVSGTETRLNEADRVLGETQMNRQYVYRLPSVRQLFSEQKYQLFRGWPSFFQAVVESSSNRATYEPPPGKQATEVRPDLVFEWLRTLPHDSLPRNLGDFDAWLYGAFCDGHTTREAFLKHLEASAKAARRKTSMVKRKKTWAGK